MPRREVPLIKGEIYHVFNRSFTKERIFRGQRECGRALLAIDYYRFENTPARLSYFLDWAKEEQERYFASRQEKRKKLVEILAFCLMPNHFHLLLKQLTKNGITRFLSLFQNSYAKYFNTKNKREGSLFNPGFKAVLIEGKKQLLHVSRYIHLNPYTGFVVKNLKELESYPWSSLPEFLDQKDGFLDKQAILDNFSGPSAYKKFVFNKADYEKKLKKMEHLFLD